MKASELAALKAKIRAQHAELRPSLNLTPESQPKIRKTRGKPPPRPLAATLEATCRHLGLSTGETVECATCSGKVALKLLACDIHGVCTTHKPVDRTACCATCKDKNTDRAPLSELQTVAPAWRETVLQETGILTAAKAEYWPLLRYMVDIARDEGAPLAIADHGLTDDQKTYVLAAGGRILDDAFDRDLFRRATALQNLSPSSPEAWMKPFVCMRTPFEHTVWIDADALPIRGLRHLFQLPTPWLTRNHWASTPNHHLYRQLASRCKVDWNRYAEICEVNTGVFAFRWGDEWVARWWEAVHMIVRDNLAHHVRTRDQAALVVAMAASKTEIPMLIHSARYNRAVNNLAAKDRHRRKKYRLDDTFLEELRKDHPDDYVVHWLGETKPWR